MDPRTLWSSTSRDHSVSSRLVTSDDLDPGEEPGSLASLRSDSGLNSLECWDYTVELEAISTGPGDSRHLGSGQCSASHICSALSFAHCIDGSHFLVV